MRKVLRASICLMLCLPLFACGAQPAVEDSASDKSDAPAATIANPWNDHETMADAVAAAGFVFSVPEAIDGHDAPLFRSMNGDSAMIEVIYYSADGEVRIRKSPLQGDETDISGDLNEYPEAATMSSAGEDAVITLYGSDGTVSKAIWNTNDYCYSVTVEPAADISTMSQIVMQVI